MKLKWNVDINNIMVKDFLLEMGLSRKLGRLIKLYGFIYVNGIEVYNYYKLVKGDELIVVYFEEGSDYPAVNNKLDVVFEDDYLLIVNKPINLTSMPSNKYLNDNLLSYVKFYLNKKSAGINPHLVNRLDMATSGLVIITKQGYIHYELQKSELRRFYLAKLENLPLEISGIINLPIGRDETSKIKRKIDFNGKEAITKYKIINKLEKIVDVEIITGRTHQIRVHFSNMDCSIVGDNLYGSSTEKELLYLSCYRLEFIHPITKEKLEINKYPNWYKG